MSNGLDLFVDLDREWTQFSRSPAGAQALARWQRTEPVLIGVDDLGCLLLALRGHCEPQLRDERMRATLGLAMTDRLAGRVVLQVVRPALSRLARSYSRRWGRDDAASLVVVTALERITAFPISDRLTNIAGHLVRDIGRVLFRAMQREVALEDVLGERVDMDRATSVPAMQPVTAAEQVVALVNDAISSGQLSRRHGQLIVAQRVLGMSTAEVALAEGRNPVAVRAMRGRAETRLSAAVAVA